MRFDRGVEMRKTIQRINFVCENSRALGQDTKRAPKGLSQLKKFATFQNALAPSRSSLRVDSLRTTSRTVTSVGIQIDTNREKRITSHGLGAKLPSFSTTKKSSPRFEKSSQETKQLSEESCFTLLRVISLRVKLRLTGHSFSDGRSFGGQASECRSSVSGLTVLLRPVHQLLSCASNSSDAFYRRIDRISRYCTRRNTIRKRWFCQPLEHIFPNFTAQKRLRGSI